MQPWLDDATNTHGIIIFTENITQRQQFLEALSSKQFFSQAIIDSLVENIAVVDHTGCITAVNKAWTQFAVSNAAPAWGHEAVGASYLDICRQVQGEERELATEAATGISAVLQHKLSNFGIEYPCHSPSQQRWFLKNVTPLSAASGGVVIAHINITARKQAEEQLRAAEAKYRTLVEGLPVISYVLDLAEPTRPVYLSPKIEPLLNYSLVEWYSTPRLWTSRIHPADRHRVLRSLVRTLKLHEALRIEYRIQTRQGDVVWLHDEGKVVQQGAAGYLLQGILQDITQRKNAEQQLQQFRCEAEVSQQRAVVTQTAAAIAHELNQPLNAVCSYAEAALQYWRAGNPKPDKLVLALEHAVRQAQRAGQTMRDLCTTLHSVEVSSGAVDVNACLCAAMPDAPDGILFSMQGRTPCGWLKPIVYILKRLPVPCSATVSRR